MTERGGERAIRLLRQSPSWSVGGREVEEQGVGTEIGIDIGQEERGTGGGGGASLSSIKEETKEPEPGEGEPPAVVSVTGCPDVYARRSVSCAGILLGGGPHRGSLKTLEAAEFEQRSQHWNACWRVGDWARPPNGWMVVEQNRLLARPWLAAPVQPSLTDSASFLLLDEAVCRCWARMQLTQVAVWEEWKQISCKGGVRDACLDR